MTYGMQMGDEAMDLGYARRRKRTAPSKPPVASTYVYIVKDDELSESRVLGVFAEHGKAKEFMLRERGKDPVGGQYIDMKRWRVR
jgi:hypothetical protein